MLQEGIKPEIDLRPMLKKICLWIFFLSASASFAQSSGDYRTIPDFSPILETEGVGYWSNLAVWQRYNGTTWVAATIEDGYPGENAVPAVVTINLGAIILLDVSVHLGSLYCNGEFASDYSDVDLIIDVELEIGSNAYFSFPSEDGDLLINGSVENAGFFSRDNNYSSGTTTFIGQFVNQSTGLFSSYVEDDGQVVFQGGIVNNGPFYAGGVTFNTNNQTISGSSQVSFSNSVFLDNVTVTNNNTAAVFITNTGSAALTGSGAATWTQGPNSTLNYSGTTITNITLNASNSGNTINYNCDSDNQTIYNPSASTYFHLILSGAFSLTKTLSANTIVSGNLSIQDAIFSVGTFDLSVAGNWSNGNSFDSDPFVGGTQTVTFNGTTSVTGTTRFNNVTVASGGTLNGPANLTLSGNFVVNGSFNPGFGRVTFNGTANQSLNRTAGSSGTVDLFDVTINKASGTFSVQATIPNTIFRVQNEFAISQAGSSNPDIDFDGSGAGIFVLGSTSTRTAKVTAVPSGTQIDGNLTVERFVENSDGVRAYRYFASPVAGATVADWLGEIQITGTFSNPSSGAGIPNPNAPSMYRWIETNGGLAANRYSAYPNNISLPASSFTLTNGTGYAVFVRDTGSPTLTTRGTLVSGNVNVNLTITGTGVNAAGFNLVGNPYPAPVDWDLVSLPGNVSPIISLIDNVSNGGLGSGQFVYYTQGGPQVGTFDGIIGSSQAFWVETSANTSLAFSESDKASDINPVIVREAQNRIANLLRINVEGNGRKDETVVYFKEDATDGYDIGFDARKRENTYINLFSYVEGESITKYAINALSGIACSREIVIGFEKFTEGTYTFNFSELESFDEPYTFSLIDNFTGTSVPVNGQPYAFQITSDPASNGTKRFKIIISEEEINSALTVQGDQKCDADNLQITVDATQSDVSYQPYYNGVAAGDVIQGNGGALVLNLHDDIFTAGIFEVAVKAFDDCAEVFLAQKAPVEVFEYNEAVIETDGNRLISNYATGNQWFLNGVQIADATEQYYDATESGLYSLQVITGECITTTDLQFLVTAAEEPVSNIIQVYPNPFKDRIRIEVKSNEPAHVSVYDARGTKIMEKLLDGKAPTKEGEFEFSENPSGLYLFRVQRDGGIYQVKIIKK
ncbi:MAG TPA: T9SS type A sorting domain-containing protein [Cyclobacteriaceae bacterium]|nr:T9SS type A sorting domain-containing protein [Cyclobacteriaceae bacterium]